MFTAYSKNIRENTLFTMAEWEIPIVFSLLNSQKFKYP